MANKINSIQDIVFNGWDNITISSGTQISSPSSKIFFYTENGELYCKQLNLFERCLIALKVWLGWMDSPRTDLWNYLTSKKYTTEALPESANFRAKVAEIFQRITQEQRVPVVNQEQRVPVVNQEQRVPVVNQEQRVPVVNQEQRVPVVNSGLSSEIDVIDALKAMSVDYRFAENSEGNFTSFDQLAIEKKPIDFATEYLSQICDSDELFKKLQTILPGLKKPENPPQYPTLDKQAKQNDTLKKCLHKPMNSLWESNFTFDQLSLTSTGDIIRTQSIQTMSIPKPTITRTRLNFTDPATKHFVTTIVRDYLPVWRVLEKDFSGYRFKDDTSQYITAEEFEKNSTEALLKAQNLTLSEITAPPVDIFKTIDDDVFFITADKIFKDQEMVIDEKSWTLVIRHSSNPNSPIRSPIRTLDLPPELKDYPHRKSINEPTFQQINFSKVPFAENQVNEWKQEADPV